MARQSYDDVQPEAGPPPRPKVYDRLKAQEIMMDHRSNKLYHYGYVIIPKHDPDIKTYMRVGETYSESKAIKEARQEALNAAAAAEKLGLGIQNDFMPWTQKFERGTSLILENVEEHPLRDPKP